jgi:pimeloyl-ACP methyl ester carboxylesterase
MLIGHHLRGSGKEKVIFSHGWFGGGLATYGSLLPYLDGNACTYALADHRGYGASKAQTGQYTMQETADDILALADHLGWERFHLVGHSMGGKMVQRVAVDAPARVKSVVAVTPVPACKLDFDAQTKALFDSAANDDGVRTGIVSFSTGNRLTPVWAQNLIARLAQESTRAAFAGYLPSWRDHDFAEQAKGLNVPIKVISGEFDPSLTRAVLEATFGPLYPNVEYETLQNSGHYPADEVPVYLATLIDAFVARNA